tara:strand:- start:232 stop:492 length:261 start_codon:yes stop_codon:yes gene_type:complete
MELEKFEKAKKIKENIDRLETRKCKLERAFKSCSIDVTIGYTNGGGFSSKGEVSVYNKEIIKEMVTKELEGLNKEIALVKEEFKNI